MRIKKSTSENKQDNSSDTDLFKEILEHTQAIQIYQQIVFKACGYGLY